MANPTTPPTPLPPSANPQLGAEREVRVYQHSQLFYWWPVWVCGYIMAIWTALEGDRLAIVPPGTKIDQQGEHYVITTPDKAKPTSVMQFALERQKVGENAFNPRISDNSRLGAIFVTVLLLVIVITNAPLRGLWSVVAIVTIILLSIILALANLWDDIFKALGNLHIHINLAGYLFIATGLFAMWLGAVFFFDRQTYMIFRPGQLKVCLEIGGGETDYDATGMTIQKHRDDLFRHWLLGLGSGDLTVQTSGAQSHRFDMHNVLNVSSKLQAITDLQREKQVVSG
ncbi:MAG: hypothetical protein U0746_20375 [Gemmataceae bacterium]